MVSHSKAGSAKIISSRKSIFDYHCWEMAENSILLKLDRELKLPIRSERQVSYILAEIRKYIEHQSEVDKERYRLLNFFCNWALHIDMYKDPLNIRKVLERFDIAEGVSLEDYQISKFYNELRRLNVFRDAVGDFCRDRLPRDIVDISEEWERFLFLYLLIVSEVPLQYTRQDLNPADVKFLKLTYTPEPKRKGRFLWEVRLRSGEDYGQFIDYGEDDWDEKIPGFFENLDF